MIKLRIIKVSSGKGLPNARKGIPLPHCGED